MKLVRHLESQGRAANPRQYPETVRPVQKELRLLVVDRWKVAFLICGRHVREQIGNPILMQLCQQIGNIGWVAIAGDLSLFLIPLKPVVCAQPSVRNPDAIHAAVVTTVLDFHTR